MVDPDHADAAGGAAGPVVEAVIVDDIDDEEEPRVPVDPPAPRGAEGVLPWRREVERRPVIAPWLKRADDVTAAVRWLLGWVWHATGYHLVRLPLYAAKLTARAPRGVVVAGGRLRGWTGDAESAPLRETAIRAGEPDQYLRLMAARAERVRVRRRLALRRRARGRGRGAGAARVGARPGSSSACPRSPSCCSVGSARRLDRPLTGPVGGPHPGAAR